MLFHRKSKPAPSTRTQPLVLIIDDEEDLCRCLRLALDGEPLEIRVAHDGERGLELIRELRPDMVLLDIKMPRMNGYQVLSALQQDAELAAIPVVVMTSLDEEGQFSAEEWARRLGVAHFVPKPFDPQKVASEVLTLLQPR